MSRPWHALGVDEALRALDVKRDGLTSEQAAARRLQYGPNRLVEKRRRGLAAMLADQFKDVTILVLLAAALVSGLLGELADTLVILVIVLLNAVIGVVQEYRAERAIAALKALAVPNVRVHRDGRVVTLPAADLVPGDLLLLAAGNLVSADLRLTECAGLQLNEAALTGESNPITKHTAPLADPQLPLGDRRNLAFRGTLVTRGRGKGLVVATGMDTEIGRIAALLEDGERPLTPLQQRLARFGRVLAGGVLAICALVFLLGLARGESPLLMFLTAVSLAVAAVPEALPAVVTIALALGARVLVQHRALIRQLPAVETLGSVTYICADKTGTLTRNRMRVEAVLVDGRRYDRKEPPTGPVAERLFEILALNNDAETNREGRVEGEPTEAALFRFVHRSGRDPAAIRSAQPRLTELPFDASRRMMTTLHHRSAGVRSYTKGAPEHVLEHCGLQLAEDGTPVPCDRGRLLAQAEGLAGHGYRVLAVAQRDWPALPEPLVVERVERELVFVGLVAMMDPPRHKVRGSVQTCATAGITPVMITGDHPTTACAIARRLGIPDGADRLLTGRDLGGMSDAQLQAAVANVRVYARVAPEQKIRIVTALQARGEFVAMTGDGVNDAPALRRANIGIAMGQGGTDVAREAAHMVLLDDDFSTIVAAVREGRRVFDNIRKFVRYIMASNSGEIWTLFLAPFLGMPLPLLPIHILWINLVTDGLPAVALSLEKKEPHIMHRPPRNPGESILGGGMAWHILWIGLLIGGLSLGTQALALGAGNPHWQTMVFTVLTFTQLCNVISIREERRSLLQGGITGNPALFGSVLLTVALQLAVIYTPFFQTVFRLQPLSARELVYCLLVSTLVIPAVELEKLLVRRGLLYRRGAFVRPRSPLDD